MQPAALPPNEAARLDALRRYQVLDTEPERGFNDLAALAAHICGTPMALISLVDEHRQWFKAHVGIDVSETCREESFCAHAILDGKPLIVPDATKDLRFHDNPLVTSGPCIRFYAGIPLVTPDSLVLGTLCVADTIARNLSEHEIRGLAALARQAEALLESRRLSLLLDEQNHKLKADLSEHRKDELALKHLNQQLEIARREAVEALQSRTRFLANVSHEIRTPLNGVVGMTDLLLATPLSKEQAEYCKTLRLSTEGLLGVVNDILDFSNLGTNQLVLTAAEFDLAEVVDDALSLAADAARSKDLRLNAFVDWQLPERVEGDRLRLRQVLVNLVGNAVKFTNTGEVRVTVHPEGENHGRTRVRFKVSDTGVGISDDQRSRIFHAFSQGDDSASRRFGGTGLGLAISKRLVEKMEGEIGFESEPSRGTTFWFYVWLRSRPTAPTSKTNTPRFSDKRALVISHSAILSSVLDYLKGLGCVTATYAAEKSLQLPAEPFDLLVVEYQCTDPSHSRILRMVEEHAADRQIPIVYVSCGSHSTAPPVREVDAVLEEPVRRASLLAALDKVLESDRPAIRQPEPARGDMTRPLRILVVEDNAINQKVVANMLRKLGHTFDLAQDGVVAVEAASKKGYDIILMDCQMPRMDGYEATRTIRREQGPCRMASIVALTASAMAEDRERCLSIGMNDYLAKPVTMEALTAALQRCAISDSATPVAGSPT